MAGYKRFLTEMTKFEMEQFIEFKKRAFNDIRFINAAQKAAMNRVHKRFFIILQKELRDE